MSNLLAQPLTPIMELSLDDIELCSDDMTRAVEVDSDLLAQLRQQLSATLLEEPTIIMPPPSFPPAASKATQESRSELARRPRPLHVFLAVLLGLVISGSELFAVGAFHRVVTKISRPW